jgi:hypothetical protein
VNVVGFAPSLNSTIQRPARAPRNSAFNETGCGAGVDQQTPGYSPSSADYFVFGTAVSLVARASVSRHKPIPHDLRIPACASMPAAPEIRSGNAIRNGQFSGPGGKADSNPRSRLSRKGLLERPAGSVLTSGRLPRRRWLRAPLLGHSVHAGLKVRIWFPPATSLARDFRAYTKTSAPLRHVPSRSNSAIRLPDTQRGRLRQNPNRRFSSRLGPSPLAGPRGPSSQWTCMGLLLSSGCFGLC